MPIIAIIVGVGIGVTAWFNGYVDLRRRCHRDREIRIVYDGRDHGKK